MQIIEDTNFGGRLGKALSTGLQGLAQAKLAHMQQEYARRYPLAQEDKLSKLLGGAGYAPEAASLIARLGTMNPAALPKILGALGAGGYGAEGAQPGIQPAEGNVAGAQQELAKPLNFAQAYAQGAQKKAAAKGSTVAEKKHYDELSHQLSNLNDIIKTSDDMLTDLKSGRVHAGIAPSILAKIAPTQLASWYSPESERFDKNGTHLVNAGVAQTVKGVASRYRVGLYEKEKPSLAHSPTVNEDILKRIKADAEEKKRKMLARYPELIEFEEEGAPPAIDLNQGSNEKANFPSASSMPGKYLNLGDMWFQSNGSDWVRVR